MASTGPRTPISQPHPSRHPVVPMAGTHPQLWSPADRGHGHSSVHPQRPAEPPALPAWKKTTSGREGKGKETRGGGGAGGKHCWDAGTHRSASTTDWDRRCLVTRRPCPQHGSQPAPAPLGSSGTQRAALNNGAAPPSRASCLHRHPQHPKARPGAEHIGGSSGTPHAGAGTRGNHSPIVPPFP